MNPNSHLVSAFLLVLVALTCALGCEPPRSNPPSAPTPTGTITEVAPAVAPPLRPVNALPGDVSLIPFGNSGATLANHLPNIVGQFLVRKSDGAILTSSEWDEGGHATAVIKDGVTVGACEATMGWGASGIGVLAQNATHIYAALKLVGEPAMQGRHDMVSPPVGTAWWGFNIYEPDCSISGGVFPMYRYFVKVAETIPAPKDKPSTDTPITGMAADEKTIYVAFASLNRIFAVDATTRKVTGSFAFSSPGMMQIDANGRLWVVRASRSGTDVVQLDRTGQPTGKKISGVAESPFLGLTASNELLVTSGLTILRYDISGSPKVTKTWSAITTGYDGTPGPFRWRGQLRGASTDGQGNLIVVWMDSAHAVYEAYSPEDRLLWQKFALVADEGTAPILNDDKVSADVYGPTDLFTVHFDTVPPSWTWKGHIHDSLDKFSGAPVGSMMVQEVGGRRLVLEGNHYGSGPVTLLTHSVGTLLQARVTYPNDQPGTNWYWHLAPNGDLIEELPQGFYYFRFKGYDSQGAPLHEKSPLLTVPSPTGDQWDKTDPLDRVIYDAKTKLLLVAGHTVQKPRGSTWGEFRVLVAYTGFDDYLKDGNARHLAQKWRLDLPYAGETGPLFEKNPGCPRGLWIVGNVLVVQFMESEALLRYEVATGAYIDQFSPAVASWLDVDAGLQGIALPNGKMFLTTLSITQESALGILWSNPASVATNAN